MIKNSEERQTKQASGSNWVSLTEREREATHRWSSGEKRIKLLPESVRLQKESMQIMLCA